MQKFEDVQSYTDKKNGVYLECNYTDDMMNTLKGVLQNQQRRNRKQSNLFVQMEDSELPRDGAPDTVALDVLYGDMADSQEFQLLVAVSEGETVKEIAQRMGISEDSCKKRVQRSRTYLKRVMEKE